MRRVHPGHALPLRDLVVGGAPEGGEKKTNENKKKHNTQQRHTVVVVERTNFMDEDETNDPGRVRETKKETVGTDGEHHRR